jgi:hypothetical protein
VILAALVLTASGAEFRTRPETRGEFTAWLEVRIADNPAEQGLAEVTLTVTVEGPARLADLKVAINDTVTGWKEEKERPAPSVRREGDTIRWTQVVALKQTRPGQVPLPGVTVTFRDGAGGAEQTVTWTDLLRQPRGLPNPAEIPEPPVAPDRRRAGAALVLIAAVVVAAAVVGRMLRPRRRPVAPTPEERAARELDAATALVATDVAAAHERWADVVRRFLAERFRLPATRQTTAEFLEALSRESSLPEQQRENLRAFFGLCDLVKFAGVRPTPDECRRTAEMARAACGLASAPAKPQAANPAAAAPTPGR